MDIEHNEQKMRDISIPLYEIEQRIIRLEEQFNSFQLNTNVTYMSE